MKSRPPDFGKARAPLGQPIVARTMSKRAKGFTSLIYDFFARSLVCIKLIARPFALGAPASSDWQDARAK